MVLEHIIGTPPHKEARFLASEPANDIALDLKQRFVAQIIIGVDIIRQKAPQVKKSPKQAYVFFSSASSKISS